MGAEIKLLKTKSSFLKVEDIDIDSVPRSRVSSKMLQISDDDLPLELVALRGASF